MGALATSLHTNERAEKMLIEERERHKQQLEAKEKEMEELASSNAKLFSNLKAQLQEARIKERRMHHTLLAKDSELAKLRSEQDAAQSEDQNLIENIEEKLQASDLAREKLEADLE